MLSCRSVSVRGALCAMLLIGGVARANPPSAASLFDDGVRKFNQADYEAAATAFLSADDAAPSAQALLNAIAAGRRGHAHLLVARAAERALARAGTDAELSRVAREALAEASAHLARIELSCEVSPAGSGACALAIDGAVSLPGTRYVLPGTHRFSGAATDAANGGGSAPRDEKALTCEAGATYVVALRPEVTSRAPASASASASAVVAPSAPAPSAAGWSPIVVYAGAGVTAALAGVTVWSGVDAIEAKKALPAVPYRAQNEDVLARAHRTDALMAGAIVAAAATVVAGVWLVAWGGASRPSARNVGAASPGFGVARVGVAVSPAGASVMLKGEL